MNNNAPHILEGIRSGRESTYSQLFQDYYRPLTVFALKYVLDLDTAKEIVQDNANLVKRVAEALLDHREMDGEALAEVLSAENVTSDGNEAGLLTG